MRTVRVTRYYADACNRGFWNKYSCLEHEKNCKCWKNPINRTCLTCLFNNGVKGDSNGMEHEPQNLETWDYRDCKNPDMKEEYLTPAHERAPNLFINCIYWKEKIKEVKK
jgi:hypothetical protein